MPTQFPVSGYDHVETRQVSMPKRVRRLFDMDVDEISTVDRAANQHAAIAFSKRAGTEEVAMPIDLYDAEGVEVFEDELESGDVVYDDDGEEFVYVAQEDAEEFGIDPDQLEYDEDESELEAVGKASGLFGGGKVRQNLEFLGGRFRNAKAGYGAGRAGRTGGTISEEAAANPNSRAAKVGWLAGSYRNPALAGAGVAGVGAAGGGGYAFSRRKRKSGAVGKSLVYDELAQALEEADTSTVIAKMADYVESARQQAEEANLRAQAIEDSFSEAEYVHKAADYSLPVEPSALGSVLHRASQVLSKRDMAVLDQVLTSAGELRYDEIGTAGGAQPEIMYEVEAYADRLVGKSDLSREEAVVAMFEANPAAYDEYLAEQNGR